MNIYPNKEGCPVELTLSVIGGKWKGILFYHMIGGKKRFNEFRRICPSITQRMLTLQLRELEADGIVHREVYQQVPPKVEYSLTEFGRSLEPIVLQMKKWGDANREFLETYREKRRLKISPLKNKKQQRIKFLAAFFISSRWLFWRCAHHSSAIRSGCKQDIDRVLPYTQRPFDAT